MYVIQGRNVSIYEFRWQQKLSNGVQIDISSGKLIFAQDSLLILLRIRDFPQRCHNNIPFKDYFLIGHFQVILWRIEFLKHVPYTDLYVFLFCISLKEFFFDQLMWIPRAYKLLSPFYNLHRSDHWNLFLWRFH